MQKIDKILNKINELKQNQKTILIAIDGFGGSGKSFLAKSIKNHFPETVIVEMDDFYSPNLKRADYLRVLNDVVKPLKENKPAHFEIYDWQNDKLVLGNPVFPGSIVVIEGVYSLHEDLANNYDIKIWLDTPQEIGFKRGLERDKNQYGVDTTEKWVKHWMPLEKEYVQSQNPKEKADFVIDGTST